MKTLHVISGLATGGAERALLNVLTGGLARRFDNVVVSLRDEGSYGASIRDLGVPVYALRLQQGFSLPAAGVALRRIVAEFKPYIVQGWMYHGNLAASLAALLAPGRPALAWNIRHSLYSLAPETPLTRQVIRANRLTSRRPDAIVYNSHLSRSQHELFGFASAVSSVIPNGFDIEALAPTRTRRGAARRNIGLGERELVVGHVARFHPMKDHAGFLRAALQVLDSRPETRFLIVGRNVSLENPALTDIVPDWLAERFIFLGERSDAHQLMQAVDVFCQSSWSEAFPNVLGEAMASGVSCVATDVGDSAHIVGDTGRIVPPKQPNVLANSILDLLAMSRAERDAMGRSARNRIENHYDLRAIVSQYANLYNKLN